MKRLPPFALLAVALAAAADAPAPKDFAHGFALLPAAGQPVQEVDLPDRLYQGITRADLSDLRVFNGAGIAVPHALCSGARAQPERVREQPLGLFTLQAGARPAAQDSSRIDVQTAGGASVHIAEPSSGANPGIVPAPAPGFIVDATPVKDPLRALQLAWSTEDGASEARVRVESSDDLAEWRVVVPHATLLHVTADGATLDRNRIELPQQPYRYLRLMREAEAVRIERVTAEAVVPAAAPPPFWFVATSGGGDPAQGFTFGTGRIAPVEAARVQPPAPNMALRVALDSRPAADAAWQQRWAGDAGSLSPNEAPAAGAAAFGPTPDPEWRVRVLAGAESLGVGRPALSLGYHPARLRFLAQGDGPFVLAYGSGRASPAEARGCDEFLAQFVEDRRAAMLGAAQLAVAPDAEFGGAAALTPPRKPTPVRQLALWGVLVLGAATLAAMALALMKQLRATPPGS